MIRARETQGGEGAGRAVRQRMAGLKREQEDDESAAAAPVIVKAEQAADGDMTTEGAARKMLHEHFKYEGFKPHQLE